MRLLVAVVAALLASPAQAQAIVEDSTHNIGIPKAYLRSALEAVLEGMFDPLSAQFKEIGRPYDAASNIIRGNTICGWVNGRNRYGAYAGFKVFGYDFKRNVLFLSDDLAGDPLSVVRAASVRSDDPAIVTEVQAACSTYKWSAP